MDALEDFLQIGGHDHQTLDALLQLHQGTLDGLQETVVAMDLQRKQSAHAQ